MGQERMNRMLANIDPQYDTSEGSFFYDNLKAVDIELDSWDEKAQSLLDKAFVETASEQWLDKKVGEQGLKRKPSTQATTVVRVVGTPNASIRIGDKVASDNANFIFKENKVIGSEGWADVLVECEAFGTIGNVPKGAIKYFPITLPGLNEVTNLQAVTNGYDGEPDEELRQRYFDKVRTPATSGNKHHYKNWAKEVVGVGDAKVFPLAQGPGTVKVIIIDSNKRGADDHLIQRVTEYIEENRPIGATVIVESAREKAINVEVKVTVELEKGDIAIVKKAIEDRLTDYFKSIAFTSSYVSYAYIGNIIFNTEGVIDYSNLKINGEVTNIPIGDTEVAVLGVVNLE